MDRQPENNTPQHGSLKKRWVVLICVGLVGIWTVIISAGAMYGLSIYGEIRTTIEKYGASDIDQKTDGYKTIEKPLYTLEVPADFLPTSDEFTNPDADLDMTSSSRELYIQLIVEPVIDFESSTTLKDYAEISFDSGRDFSDIKTISLRVLPENEIANAESYRVLDFYHESVYQRARYVDYVRFIKTDENYYALYVTTVPSKEKSNTKDAKNIIASFKERNAARQTVIPL